MFFTFVLVDWPLFGCLYELSRQQSQDPVWPARRPPCTSPALELGAAEAFQNGADKYGPFNWRDHQISATVYYAACKRHLDDWFDRKDPDDAAPDSGVSTISSMQPPVWR